MTYFHPIDQDLAYLKAGFMGFAGSGKTKTSTLLAIGLIRHMRDLQMPVALKPVFFADTEKGSKWVRQDFKDAGIELKGAETRAFADLVGMVKEAEENASLLIVDSLTHFWIELCDAYMRTKKRTRLQFEDWAYLKTEWRKFTDIFVNSNLHIVVAGRAGFEYDYAVDEETGKKNLEKTDIKFRAEGEMGYEPSLLVLMERHMESVETKRQFRIATILKDRSGVLDGQQFTNPKFENFLPHIERLNLAAGALQASLDTSRTSDHIIPRDIRDNRRTQRKIVLAEIEDLLVLHFPSTAQKDKAAKIALIKSHFQASWVEMEELMPLERLRAGFETLHLELEGKPSRYAAVMVPTGPIDEIPQTGGAVIVKPNGLDPAKTTDPNWVENFMG